MRKAISVFVLALLAISFLVMTAQAASMPDEVIAKYKPNIGFRTKSFVGSSLGLRQMRTVFSSDFAVYAVPAGLTPEATIARLQSSPYVLYAERNPIAYLTAEPNDPAFRNQWSLKTPADGNYGINLPDAWAISVGLGVQVAVLDTGCAYEDYSIYYANPDLDPLRVHAGWDFVNQDIHPDDDSNIGHGTFLCSLIADTANNGFGDAGIAPGCTLMPVKCFDADGVSTADRIASGLSYASRFDARVILIGGATSERSQCLQDMIDQAAARGALIVAGAGNNGVNVATAPGVHAVYNHVMYVGATAKDGSLAPYSNRGSFISVVAPGGASAGEAPIASTYSPYDTVVPRFGLRPDGTSIQPMHGTSVAAAHVAGVAALVMGALPAIPPDVARAQIESTAVPLGDSTMFGAGLVDATAAVGATTTIPGGGGGGGAGGDTPPGTIDAAVTDLSLPVGPVVVGNALQVGVSLRNNGGDTKTVTVTVQDDTNGVTIATQDVGLTPGQATTLTFPWTVLAPEGMHTVRASISLLGDANTANNIRTATVAVNPAQLQLRISPSKSAYRGGDWIFVNFSATDGGQPAPGTKIQYTILGATGYPVVKNAVLTANAAGEALMTLTYYYSFGGRGTYLIEATATRNGASTTSRQTFIVNGARG
jgi:serine protease